MKRSSKTSKRQPKPDELVLYYGEVADRLPCPLPPDSPAAELSTALRAGPMPESRVLALLAEHDEWLRRETERVDRARRAREEQEARRYAESPQGKRDKERRDVRAACVASCREYVDAPARPRDDEAASVRAILATVNRILEDSSFAGAEILNEIREARRMLSAPGSATSAEIAGLIESVAMRLGWMNYSDLPGLLDRVAGRYRGVEATAASGEQSKAKRAPRIERPEDLPVVRLVAYLGNHADATAQDAAADARMSKSWVLSQPEWKAHMARRRAARTDHRGADVANE